MASWRIVPVLVARAIVVRLPTAVRVQDFARDDVISFTDGDHVDVEVEGIGTLVHGVVES